MSDYKYELVRDRTISRLNGQLFIHNDLAKLEIMNKNFYYLTLKVISLMELDGKSEYTVSFDNIVTMSERGKTTLRRPSEIIAFINTYKKFIYNPIAIIGQNKNILLFDKINVDKQNKQVLFEVAPEADYLLLKDKKEFFTIRGEYIQELKTYSTKRLFMYLYSHMRWREVTLARKDLTSLCGIKESSNSTYIANNIINPTLKFMKDNLGTGSWIADKKVNKIIDYNFHWTQTKTANIGLTKRQEVKFIHRNNDVSLEENASYTVDKHSKQASLIGYLLYKYADSIKRKKAYVDDQFLNIQSITNILDMIENKYKCTFTNKEELAKYFDENR